MKPVASLDIVRAVRDARFSSGYACVHCHGQNVIRWGGFAGRQRYRCRSCQRTFSDLTHTAFAYSKKVATWAAYLDHVRRGMTLRYAAAALDVHVGTTFRWRHALLTALRVADSSTLSGTIELKEIAFAHSLKGSRNVREPRQRGARQRWEWFDVARDRVLIGRARSGSLHAETVGGDVVSQDSVRRVLLPRLDGRCAFIGRMPRAGPCVAPLRAAGHDFSTASITIVERSYERCHVRNVEAYARRLLVWLERFRGVASRYRDNYLLWHRIVDPDDGPVWACAVVVASIAATRIPP